MKLPLIVSVGRIVFEKNINRKANDRDVSITVSSDLNLLEQQYLGLQNTATLEKAHTLGLSETGTPLFISRKSLGKGISLRDEI